jgi:hypothetical protein
MYTNSLPSSDNLKKNIQGPCGNSTFQLLSTTNDYDGITTIPHIDDEQIIIEERYSINDGCFGMVKKKKIIFYLFLIQKNLNIDCSRLYISSSTI